MPRSEPTASPAPASGPDRRTPIVLRGASVELGGRRVLDSIELVVGPGETVALAGPSGAGKSTLLRLCVGSVTANDPETVRILGVDRAAASERASLRLSRRVAMIHQQLDLVGPLKVVHNVNAGHLGEWGRLRAMRSLLRPVQLEEARRALAAVGIADKLFDRTDRLSGGEQQRVALARVLVQNPDLILADEPVSSLDPARADGVMVLLTEMAAAHRALLVSLHDFDLARRRCDRVVGLRDGRIMFDLPAAEVTDELGRRLYRVGS